MADHRARIIENQLTGLHLNIDGHDMYSRLIGEFNASNLLAVYTVAIVARRSAIERADRAKRPGTTAWSFPGRAQQRRASSVSWTTRIRPMH